MDKLALILAVAGLGLGGYAAFGSTDTDASGYEATTSDASSEIASLRAEVAALREQLAAEGPMAAVGTGDGGTLSGRAGAATPARMTELEKRFDAFEERMAKVERDPTAGGITTMTGPDGKPLKGGWSGRPPRMFGGPSGFLASPEQAQKQLELDPGQRAQLDRVVEDTKAELDRLYDTADEDGTTMREAMKLPTFKFDASGKGREDMAGKIMGHFAKTREFKKKKIPGSNETFGEAEKRIKDKGKRDARDLLNDDQKKKWDNSHTDPLFGAGPLGAGTVVSFESSSEAFPVPGGGK